MANQEPFGWTSTNNINISLKSRNSRMKINPLTGTSIAQDAGKKQSETKNKIDPDTGTTIYQDSANKIKNNYQFFGYFVVLGKSYETAEHDSSAVGVSKNSIKLWYKTNNLKKLTRNRYNKCEFFQRIGKSFFDIGF